MPAVVDQGKRRLGRLRRRFPPLDHAVDAVLHYTAVNGNGQAGAVTFFGFLSFFPILALGFVALGVISQVAPELRDSILVEVENLLPGVVGGDPGEIPLSTFEDAASTVGPISSLVLVYAGLGWLSGMRRALEVMFVMPTKEQPNFVVGKATDLAVLLVIGFTLLVSVGLSALVSGFSERLIALLGFDPDATVPLAVLRMVTHGMAIFASTVLLLAMFRLLARPHLPRTALLWGALLGAVGFELLKAVANQLLGLTQGKPAFQAFGVALILLVWINYFSRLVMLAAAWAYTARASSDRRRAESLVAPAAALQGTDAAHHLVEPVVDVSVPSPVVAAPRPSLPSPWQSPSLDGRHDHRGRWAVLVAGGGLGLAALWAWLRRAGA